jgi:hypothetical protein
VAIATHMLKEESLSQSNSIEVKAEGKIMRTSEEEE